MKTINQYLDKLLSLPADRKNETVMALIRNLQELKWTGANGGNDPLLNETLKRRIENELRNV